MHRSFLNVLTAFGALVSSLFLLELAVVVLAGLAAMKCSIRYVTAGALVAQVLILPLCYSASYRYWRRLDSGSQPRSPWYYAIGGGASMLLVDRMWMMLIPAHSYPMIQVAAVFLSMLVPYYLWRHHHTVSPHP